MYIYHKFFLFLLFNSLFGLQASNTLAQDFPYRLPQYPFVRYDLNKIKFNGDSAEFMKLFNKMSVLERTGEGQLNIVHLGDSHIQADIFSGRVRRRMQTFIRGANAGRGYVFPYRLAHTNQPYGFFIKATGKWMGTSVLRPKFPVTFGIGGMVAITADAAATLQIILKKEDFVKYEFNKVRIFYNNDSLSFQPVVDNGLAKMVAESKEEGWVDFEMNRYTDTLLLHFEKQNDQQKRFQFWGVSLTTDDPGIVYHSMGVNGADFDAWLRDELLFTQLSSLKPDLLIVSLGTNDVYTKVLNQDIFNASLSQFIARVELQLPGVPVLFTTPGDHYRYRRALNFNTELAVKFMLEQTKEKSHMAVWDMNQIMGGQNSIVLWTKYGLTAGDKLHYNSSGYILQADLLFNAFLESYDNYIDINYRNKILKLPHSNQANKMK